MNRRRNEPRTHVSVFFAPILAFVIAASGGVLHAVYKNRQIQVSREIDAIDRRIDGHRLAIRTTQMRMDEMLNRFAIRKQIEENGSALRPIAHSAIEEIKSPPGTYNSVAATP